MSDTSNNPKLNTVINVFNNKSVYLDIRAKELQKWHKIWFYGYTLVIIILLIMILIIVKVSNVRRRRRISRAKEAVKIESAKDC